MMIYVIRHGETELNARKLKQGWLDYPLNQAGRDLARITGQAMKDIRFDACFSSPLIRAKETAEIVLQESGNGSVPVQTDDRLKEYYFGEEEGTPVSFTTLPRETAELYFTDALRFPGFPGGESIQDLCWRTGEFLREICARSEYRNVLIGTHGCALRAMMNPLYDEPEHFWQKRVPANCSVTILEVTGGQPRIVESDKIYYDPALAVDHYEGIIRK